MYYYYNNGRSNKYAEINFLLCRSKARFSVVFGQKNFWYQGQIDFHFLHSVVEEFTLHWMCMCSSQFPDLLQSDIWNQILPKNGSIVFSGSALLHQTPAHSSPVSLIFIPCIPDDMTTRYKQTETLSHYLQGSHTLESLSPGQTLTDDI